MATKKTVKKIVKKNVEYEISVDGKKMAHIKNGRVIKELPKNLTTIDDSVHQNAVRSNKAPKMTDAEQIFKYGFIRNT